MVEREYILVAIECHQKTILLCSHSPGISQTSEGIGNSIESMWIAVSVALPLVCPLSLDLRLLAEAVKTLIISLFPLLLSPYSSSSSYLTLSSHHQSLNTVHQHHTQSRPFHLSLHQRTTSTISSHPCVCASNTQLLLQPWWTLLIGKPLHTQCCRSPANLFA
jgi:hypothetical protein